VPRKWVSKKRSKEKEKAQNEMLAGKALEIVAKGA